MENPKKSFISNALVSKLTLIALQVIIILSIYLLVRTMVFPSHADVNIGYFTIVTGSMLAPITAFLILYKYQSIIQDFTLKSEKIEKQVETHTAELLEANKKLVLEISERKRIEAALAESEMRFRTIIREAALGIAVIDMRGRLLECNPVLQKMLGYGPEELSSMVFLQFSQSENFDSNIRYLKELFKRNRKSLFTEKRYIRKDGQEGWWRQSISIVRDAEGEPKFVICMIEDITEHKRADEEIRRYQNRLKSLASELSLTEERERRNLATLLHDQIAQILSIAKIKIEGLQEAKISKQLKSNVFEVHRLVETGIQYTRSLIFELSPPLLYDLGFTAAVEWLAENMHKQYGLPIKLEVSHQPEELNNEERILLFRAVRELLFNIIKHAKANLAIVIVRKHNGSFQVIVEDNGVGFPQDKLPSQILSFNELGGFGLFSISERLNYLGGRLDIESSPQRGTRITMDLPLRPEPKGLSVDDVSVAQAH